MTGTSTSVYQDPSITLNQHSISASPKSASNKSRSPDKRSSPANTIAIQKIRNNSPSIAGGSSTDAQPPQSLHFLSRKREYERIDYENKKIKKGIEGQKPAVDFRKFEKDFNHHMKIKGFLARGKHPIESFMKKRMDMT